MLISSKIILLVVAILFVIIQMRKNDYPSDLLKNIQDLLHLYSQNVAEIKEIQKLLSLMRNDYVSFSTIYQKDFNADYKQSLKNLTSYAQESLKHQKVSGQIQVDIASLSQMLNNLDLSKGDMERITRSHEKSIARLVSRAEINLDKRIENAEKSMLRVLNTIKQNARLNVKNHYTIEEFERDLNGI